MASKRCSGTREPKRRCGRSERPARTAEKTKVAIFDGSYHGSHDYVLLVADPESPRAAPVAVPRGAGIPQETVDQVLMLPYRHEAAYELIWEHKDELALVMLEPVQSSNPRLDCGDFVRGVANVCREAGVLFLMDEVVTGFRLSYGGGQEFFDVKPDLATYGKALGGGLPMGAVVGRADVMEVFRIDIERPKDEEAVFAGGDVRRETPSRWRRGVGGAHPHERAS